MLVPIHPPLDGRTAERFPVFVRALSEAQIEGNRNAMKGLLQREVDWCRETLDLGEQALIYEASVRVISDLVRLRWRVVERGHGFCLENPQEEVRGRSVAELVASKEALRDELRPIVDEQRTSPQVSAFLGRMERGGRGCRSVLELEATELELADRLGPAAALRGLERTEALRSAVMPYLQRATADVDVHTGHSLREIWRYFRFRWSIPQTPVPGRQMLYLVRDAAHPRHAVIGIASMNNCPLEMGEVRERFIGWHRRGVVERILSARKGGREALQAELEWLQGRIFNSLAEVEWTNLVTPEEVLEPTEEIVARLARRGKEFASVREKLLRELASGDRAGFDGTLWDLEDAPPVGDEVLQLEAKASVDARMHAARKQLIAKKRAHAIGRLLNARRLLALHAEDLCDPDRVEALLLMPEVITAINVVVEALKARRAGANMLEVTTCGAIGAYGQLLGGKLVALMMLSPEVAADYRAAYDRPSIISSQMKNSPFIRDNALVYLGTTSLYVHGSSQYNRLRLPAGTIAPDQPELKWVPIGQTTGFGTVQFSTETARAIDALLSSRNEFRDVNSVFGEGTSPKLRKLKAGMRLIGFPPDSVLRHQQRRLIYAAPLSGEARDWLLERTTVLTSYLENPERFRSASGRIAEFWRARWLAMRLDGWLSRLTGTTGIDETPQVREEVEL